MAQAFDTLTAARDLEAAGFDRGQAEAVAAAIGAGHGDLAVKADLRALEIAIEAKLLALETRLAWRMMAMLAAAVAVNFGLLRLMLP